MSAAVWYVDSSVLVKRYLHEPGSRWLQHQFQHHEVLVMISDLGRSEIISALNRVRREGKLSVDAYQLRRDTFLNHCQTTYQIIAITSTLIDETMRLMEVHPLRTYDALHLATFRAVSAQMALRQLAIPTLLAADGKLLAAARDEGLPAIDPVVAEATMAPGAA